MLKNLKDQAKITDFDAFLAEAKREFMEVNFVGQARPEVLAGANVYAKLDELVGDRRNLFLKDRREIQKKRNFLKIVKMLFMFNLTNLEWLV